MTSKRGRDEDRSFRVVKLVNWKQVTCKVLLVKAGIWAQSFRGELFPKSRQSEKV